MKRKISSIDLERASKFIAYKNDITLWASEQVRIPLAGDDRLVDLYDPQKRVLNSFLKDHYLVLLKSRQTGFSTLCQIIVAFMATFYQNIVMGILSRDGSEASDFNRKVCDILTKQDKWLQPSFNNAQGGFINAQSFKTTKGNQLWSSAISPSNPGSVFRGKAITLLIVDEAAHAKYIDEAWTGIGPALSKAQRDAKIKKIPYGTIILSSPNRTQGIGKWYFERWSQATSNPDGLWKPHKIHWKEIPMFKDDPTWYPEQCEVLENNPRKIAQELNLQFVPASGMFSEKVYNELQHLKSEIIEKTRINSESWMWRFAPIDRRKYYIIGVDTASEFGTDWSTIQVLEYEEMDQIIEYRGKTSVKEFASILKRIVGLVPHNFIVIENNSYGMAVCEELYMDNYQHYNVYGTWRNKPHMAGAPKTKEKIFQPGLNTNVKTRPLIMDALYKYVDENTSMIKSERLALELISLIDKGNKVEADLGANDDLALAYAFCCYARHYLKEITVYKNTPTKQDQETIVDDPMNWMIGMNGGSPLKGQAKALRGNVDAFNKVADDYISKNFHKLQGSTVNVMDLIGNKKKNPFFW